MSSIDLNTARPISSLVCSASDIARLINVGGSAVSHARTIVLLALGGIFLDAYNLTTLSYGIDDVTKEFGLTPALKGFVGSAIMIGTILGSLPGGWLSDKIGRYQVFMADMLFLVVAAIAAGLAPNVWVLIGARFVMGWGVGIDLPGTGMFWVVAISAITPIGFLLAIRREPAEHDIDDEVAP